jgi:hypothetical protein
MTLDSLAFQGIVRPLLSLTALRRDMYKLLILALPDVDMRRICSRVFNL